MTSNQKRAKGLRFSKSSDRIALIIQFNNFAGIKMAEKTILITGATAGIGLAVAKHNIKLGNKVLVTGRNQDKLDSLSSELNVSTYLVDSADLSHIHTLGESLQCDGIKLDAVVLNAGIFYPRPFNQITPEHYEETTNINTRGPIFTLHSLLPSLTSPSSVVFISSIAAFKGFVGGSIYSASKAAFEGVVRSLNIELAEAGVRINVIRPGVTATEIQEKAGMTKEQQDEFFNSLSSIPLQRVLTPNDHLSGIQYLIEDGSIGVRNAFFDIDGGYCG